MIKKSTHLAELDLGGATETVLVRDVQWDHLGKEIIHLDFARVSAEEIDRDRGPARARAAWPPASPAGGVLEHLVHSLQRSPAAPGAIPDSIKVDVSHLQLDEGVHVRDLTPARRA